MVKRKTARKRGGNPGKKGPYWLYGLHSVAAALANPERRCLKLLATQQGAAALAGHPASPRPPADAPLPPQIAGRIVHVRLLDLHVVDPYRGIELDVVDLDALAHHLPVHLTLRRHVDDEIPENLRRAAEAPTLR